MVPTMPPTVQPTSRHVPDPGRPQAEGQAEWAGVGRSDGRDAAGEQLRGADEGRRGGPWETGASGREAPGPRACLRALGNGAEEGTRTLTSLRSPAPQAGVSTYSTTSARNSPKSTKVGRPGTGAQPPAARSVKRRKRYSAMTYSPTPLPGQYHRRWWA